MNYQLYKNSMNDLYRTVETILRNRGIENPREYMNLDDSCLIDYKLLDNIKVAVECFLRHIENNSNIHIIVDSDVDGYTSASMIYQYIKSMNKQINITYSLHTGKQHGITEDIEIPDNINLLIMPDAGTNDSKQCQELKQKNIDIIILDHHEKEEENPYAIVVNNQTSNRYSNKDLCGAGIVYKFLQAVDEESWNEGADEYLDLVSLANIADSMNIKSFETKRLIDKGLYNTQNKFFEALINKQSYSIGTKLTINGVQFYVAPLLNALIRVGSQEEKDILFKALVQEDAYFEYKTRATKDRPSQVIQESIYDRAVRFCANAKGKQSRIVEKNWDKLCQYIETNSLNKNKIMFIPSDGFIERSLTGLAAIRLASKYNKPCLLLRKKRGTENIFAGSARNINNSPVASLKDLLDETNLFQKIAGHKNAFGVEIDLLNIPTAIKKLDTILDDTSFEPCYLVDFEINAEDVNIGIVYDIASLSKYYGQGLEEARLHIKNVCIDKSQISLIGKNSDTIKFTYEDEIEVIKFKCSESESLMEELNDSMNDSDELTLNIIGRVNINTYGNTKTPQIIIDDYELIKKGA